jgi:signal transduction histidine kinase
VGSTLPAGLLETTPDTRRPSPVGHRGLLGVQLAAMLAFAAAAVGFARRAERAGDTFLRWLALAATIAALARLHYVLFPPLRSDWLYSGDVLRLAAYVLLVVGAAKEISGYWRNLAETAVLEERRRIARDLHDGVAQELAYIGRRAGRLASDPIARQIAAAAERGLADSRRAIAALTRPLDEPLEEVLGEATLEVGARLGIPVELDLARGVAVGGDTREALLRIACEAVANAARHADATRVRVELGDGDRVRLRVVDDGVGFDAGAAPDGAAGFGLVSMRERAKAVGGRLEIRSCPGEGTAVEVEL